MVSLKLQKRLAAKNLGVGKRKVWLDPVESKTIAKAKSHAHIRNLIRRNLIVRKPHKCPSRGRVREFKQARLKGRHRGPGSRRGTAEARNPSKALWIKRIRVLRRLLVKYRDTKKIDPKTKGILYRMAKGGVFKNKRVLIEHIHKRQAEIARSKTLAEQYESHRKRNKAFRERKAAKAAQRVEDGDKSQN